MNKNSKKKTTDEQRSLTLRDIIITSCLSFHNIIVGANLTGPTLFNYTPPFTCKDFEEQQNACSLTQNNPDAMNVSKLSTGTNQTFICPTKYEYHGDRSEITVVTEWNLVCNNKIYDALSITWFFVAVSIGTLITGTLMDRYGRKLILFCSVFSQAIIATIISLYANTYILYVVLHCIQGLFIHGIFGSVYTLVTELLPKKYQTIATAVVELFWGFGTIVITTVFYIFPNWREANLVMALAPLLITLISVWIVPESTKWKESRRKFKLGESENLKIVKKPDHPRSTISNGLSQETDPASTAVKQETLLKKDESEGENETHTVDQSQKSSGSIFSLLKTLFFTARLRTHLILMMYLWFTEAVSFFGVTFLIPELSGNHYINLICCTSIELTFFVIMSYLISKLGRKTTTCGGYLVGSICYLCAAFISKESSWASYLQIGFVILGKASVVGNYMSLLLYTVQLFPTQLNGIAIGIGNFCSQIGIMVAPFVILLSNISWIGVPFILFSVLHIISSIAAYIMLPKCEKDSVPTKSPGEIN